MFAAQLPRHRGSKHPRLTPMGHLRRVQWQRLRHSHNLRPMVLRMRQWEVRSSAFAVFHATRSTHAAQAVS